MLFVLTAHCAMAQPYKPMSQFGTDTLNYLKYNFETRKNQYIGYTLEKIINDYELEMKKVNYVSPFISCTREDELSGINIDHISIFEWRRRWDNKTPMIEFQIDFEPPYTNLWATSYYAPSFNTERERALYIKDKIVKDIKVYIFDRNVPPPPPPPPKQYDDIIIIPPQVQYNVSVLIDGNGTITGAGQYHASSKVTLTATPFFGHIFVGWQGDITSTSNPLIITNIAKNYNITAKFASTLPPTNPGDDGGNNNPKLPKKDLELTPLQ